jgi:hypothetical protein
MTTLTKMSRNSPIATPPLLQVCKCYFSPIVIFLEESQKGMTTSDVVSCYIELESEF